MKKTVLPFFLTFIISTSPLLASEVDSTWLDFWVGKWEASWDNGDGTLGSATNHIFRTLGDFVIEENFSQTGVPKDQAFIGRSYSVFNKFTKEWKQTWVDNSGAYLDFKSGEDNGDPVFWRKFTNTKGQEIYQRMVFYNISKEKFDWRWENSTDQGETWNLSWKIAYSRAE